jgi:hypothetical protein
MKIVLRLTMWFIGCDSSMIYYKHSSMLGPIFSSIFRVDLLLEEVSSEIIPFSD